MVHFAFPFGFLFTPLFFVLFFLHIVAVSVISVYSVTPV